MSKSEYKNNCMKIKFLMLVFVLLAVASCKKDDTTSTTSVKHVLGETFQGGKVAYILQAGDAGYNASIQHGIIAAPSDQSAGISWIINSSSPQTDATSLAIGSGNANTNKIVAAYGTGNYAAKLCSDLVLGGYSDWYLPSIEELVKLYDNRSLIGGFTGGWYWSSTEDVPSNSSHAWCVYFDVGQSFSEMKDGVYLVRAVRSY